MQSESVENFLKAVYVLQQRMERVSTNALAEVLDIAPPSVTDMARRMESAGLVDYRKYYGVLLTTEGESMALRVIRRHRLIELYLVKELGYDLHEVHMEAERLEHAVSDQFVNAIAQKLDHPEVDPHGDPIPTVDGIVTRPHTITLAELPINRVGTVSRLIAINNDMLAHIVARGFKLGESVSVMARDPFEGPLTVNLNNQERIIGYNVAQCILVEFEMD